MNEDYRNRTFCLERDHWWYRARRETIVAQFRRRFKGRNGVRILDVGCGAGTILGSLTRFAQAIGLDAFARAVEVSRQRGCDVELGSIPDDVPADIGRFDAVCLFDVIEHLNDDVGALRCAHNLLMDGGAIFVTVPALPWLYGIHDEINHHRRRYTDVLLSDALAAAGFVRVRTSYFNTLLSPLLIPAILWRSYRRSGDNFEVESRLSPLLERVFSFERFLVGCVRLPFGLSLFATAEKG